MRRNRGHTLIETVASVGVFTALTGVTFAIVHDTGAVVSKQYTASVERRHSTDASLLLGEEIGDADAATLAISTTPLLGDTITFQLAIDDPSGALVWGATCLGDATRADHAGATVNYLVVGQSVASRCKLVRRVVDSTGAVIGTDQVLIDDLAMPDQQLGKGFTATRAGNLVTLRLRQVHGDGSSTCGSSYGCVDARAPSDIVIRLRNG